MVVRKVFIVFSLLFITACQVDNSVKSNLLTDPNNPAVLKLTSAVSSVSLNEGDKLTVIIQSDKVSPKDILINWNVSNGGIDFEASTGSVTLLKGQKSFSVNLSTINDSDFEPTKNFVLSFSSSDNNLSSDVAINIELINDDPEYLIGFGSTSSSVAENSGSVNIPIQINQSYSTDVAINYSLSGTATTSDDFSIVSSGSVTLSGGQTSVNIPVILVDDGIIEGDESLILTIDSISPTQVVLDSTKNTYTLNLSDDDIIIGPTNAYIFSGETMNFTASSGYSGYTYSIVESVNSTVTPTGTLMAAGNAETFTVRVTDSNGLTKDATVEVIKPTDNVDLKSWVKAQALALTDSDPVASWTDLTSNGNSFSQGTSGNRPLFKSNVLNGYPVVRFDGVNDYLDSSFVPATGAGARSFTTVITNILDTPNKRALVYDWGDSVVFGRASGLSVSARTLESVAGQTFIFDNHQQRTETSSFVPVLNSTPYIVTVDYDGTTLKMIINGKLALTKSTTLSTAAGTGLKIGTKYSGSFGFFKGDLAELMAYTASTADAERKKIECALGRKYDIQVDNGLECGVSSLRFDHDNLLAVEKSQTVQVKVLGGLKPYIYSVVSGQGSVDASSGLFSAPSTTGVTRVRAVDQLSNAIEMDINTVDIPRPFSWLNLSQTSYVDSDPISMVYDLSGNKRHYSQKNGSYKPTFKSNALNSQPSMLFSGGQFLNGNYLPPASSNNPRTFAMVVTNGSGDGNIFSYGHTLFCNQLFNFKFNSTAGFIQLNKNCTTISSTAVTSSAPKIIYITYDGTKLIIRENGADVYNATFSISTSLFFAIKLGTNHKSDSLYFNGEIAEFLVYDSSLSVADRDKVENYLSGKFGITLN